MRRRRLWRCGRGSSAVYFCVAIPHLTPNCTVSAMEKPVWEAAEAGRAQRPSFKQPRNFEHWVNCMLNPCDRAVCTRPRLSYVYSFLAWTARSFRLEKASQTGKTYRRTARRLAAGTELRRSLQGAGVDQRDHRHLQRAEYDECRGRVRLHRPHRWQPGR